MKPRVQFTALLVAAATAGAMSAPALAQGHAHAGMGGMGATTGMAGMMGKSAEAPASGEMSEGEVRKIDFDNKKITLRHGPLRNLDMPGMTMVFQVGDASMLTGVKVGDKVRFVAGNPGGTLTLSQLEKVN